MVTAVVVHFLTLPVKIVIMVSPKSMMVKAFSNIVSTSNYQKNLEIHTPFIQQADHKLHQARHTHK